jgi:hypothetical protein
MARVMKKLLTFQLDKIVRDVTILMRCFIRSLLSRDTD